MGIFNKGPKKTLDEQKQRALSSSILGIKLLDGCVWEKPPLKLRGDVVYTSGGQIAGAHASVESAGQIRTRVTATRLVTLGIFAFAAKKKVDDREVYLSIEGADFAICRVVRADNQSYARRWAAQFNTYALQLASADEVKAGAAQPDETSAI